MKPIVGVTAAQCHNFVVVAARVEGLHRCVCGAICGVCVVCVLRLAEDSFGV